MDPRRRFNKRERSALHRLAGGRCVGCNAELTHGWHADHINPHSGGGATDVINGQALCPDCNLKKGNRVPRPPRPWQKQFLSKYTAAANPTDFLLVACPGAGKTLAAAYVARDLIRDQVIERILIVVPSFPLREQWRKAIAEVGLLVDEETMNNPIGEMATRGGSATHGWVVTYQSLAAAPLDHRAINGRRPTLAILDEVHHLSSDGGKWGAAAIDALTPCVRRLSLSGTPFRGDSTRIPFVEYEPTPDGGQQCRYRDAPDGTPYPNGFDYSYGVALTDQPPPVRPVVFEHYDGDVEWMDWTDAKPTRVTISDNDIDKETRRRANRHVLNPAGEWLTAVLRGADERLQMVRDEGDVTAGGLVVCLDTKHADAVAEQLRGITTGRVFTAISIDENGQDCSKQARDVIENFEDSDGRWLVAVQMVTEGVDIPRLRVGVYATTVRSPLFFRQVVGRVVRRRDDLTDDIDQTSYLFVPKEPKMLALADAVQDEVTVALIASAEDDGVERTPGPERDLPELPMLPFDPFRESNATDTGVLIPGLGDLSSALVKQVAERCGQPYGATASVIAAAMQMGVGFAPPTASASPAVQAERPRDRLTTRRSLLEKLIKQYTAKLLRQRGDGQGEFGRLIALVKSEVYEVSGIYQPRMTAAERKHAYKRADLPVVDEAISYVTKLLGES